MARCQAQVRHYRTLGVQEWIHQQDSIGKDRFMNTDHLAELLPAKSRVRGGSTRDLATDSGEDNMGHTSVWSREYPFDRASIQGNAPKVSGVYEILQSEAYPRYQGSTRVLK